MRMSAEMSGVSSKRTRRPSVWLRDSLSAPEDTLDDRRRAYFELDLDMVDDADDADEVDEEVERDDPAQALAQRRGTKRGGAVRGVAVRRGRGGRSSRPERSTCHQCKNRRNSGGLVDCVNLLHQDSTSGAVIPCRRKYCGRCVEKHYSDIYSQVVPTDESAVVLPLGKRKRGSTVQHVMISDTNSIIPADDEDGSESSLSAPVSDGAAVESQRFSPTTSNSSSMVSSPTASPYHMRRTGSSTASSVTSPSTHSEGATGVRLRRPSAAALAAAESESSEPLVTRSTATTVVLNLDKFLCPTCRRMCRCSSCSKHHDVAVRPTPAHLIHLHPSAPERLPTSLVENYTFERRTGRPPTREARLPKAQSSSRVETRRSRVKHEDELLDSTSDEDDFDSPDAAPELEVGSDLSDLEGSDVAVSPVANAAPSVRGRGRGRGRGALTAAARVPPTARLIKSETTVEVGIPFMVTTSPSTAPMSSSADALPRTTYSTLTSPFHDMSASAALSGPSNAAVSDASLLMCTNSAAMSSISPALHGITGRAAVPMSPFGFAPDPLHGTVGLDLSFAAPFPSVFDL